MYFFVPNLYQHPLSIGLWIERSEVGRDRWARRNQRGAPSGRGYHSPNHRAYRYYDRIRARFAHRFRAAGEVESMKVILLYPEFPDTVWSIKHVLKFIRK
jgi:hypothetical protein